MSLLWFRCGGVSTVVWIFDCIYFPGSVSDRSPGVWAWLQCGGPCKGGAQSSGNSSVAIWRINLKVVFDE